MDGIGENVTAKGISKVITVSIDGELLERFKDVKKGLGVHRDSEVLRIALWHYIRTGAY